MLNKLVDCAEETCGFSRDSRNPDSRGWVDIIEWLLADPRTKSALLARFADRIEEEDHDEADAYGQDDDRYVGPFPLALGGTNDR